MSHIIVIGGGPAGSTCATLLAHAGHDVTVMEKANFPRYHVGESLAPAAQPILGLSGALDKVEKSGFITKMGGLMRWGGEDFTIEWEAVYGKGLYTWQVERDKFDKVLLDHAADSGVTVHEGRTVRRVVSDSSGRPVAVKWTEGKETGTTEADYIVDASGRTGVLPSQKRYGREGHDIFRNVAIWGYWRDANLLPGTPAGGLDAVSCPTGWYWTIPLQDNRYSVGFVTHRDNFRELRAQYPSVEDVLMACVNTNDDMKKILHEAEFLGPTRVETDYSYVTEKFSGPGHVIIGDSACFLDPLLSTGTHMALYSAVLGAASISAAAKGTVAEDEAIEFFERRCRHAYQRYLSMVSLMYQQYRGHETYFWHAQRLLKDGERRHVSKAAFTKLVSGMADLRDVGYSNPARPSEDPENPELSDADTFTTPQIPVSTTSDGKGGLRLITDPTVGLARV